MLVAEHSLVLLWGKAPLHFVSGQGHIDCMRHLLDSNANPNLSDNLKGKLSRIQNFASCSLRGAESNGLGQRQLRRSLPT